jgi:hypothetical protein
VTINVRQVYLAIAIDLIVFMPMAANIIEAVLNNIGGKS